MIDQLPDDSTPHVEAALAYAQRGWRVFPIQPRGKLPALPSAHPDGDPARGRCRGECGRDGHGFHDATLDEARILNWWLRQPAAGVGIATGRASGLVVIDIDAGKGGYDTLAALKAAHPNEAALLTLEAATGGGGSHLLFAYPDGELEVRNRSNVFKDTFGPGIDVRATGGYIVAAPSLHASGRRYAWCTSEHSVTDVAPLPGWLLAALNATPVEPVREPAGDQLDRRIRRPLTGDAADELERYWRMVLSQRLAQLDQTVSGRNDALNEAAFRMGQVVALGAPRETIRASLVEAAEVLRARGWRDSRAQAERTIDSGLAAGEAEPDRWFRPGRPRPMVPSGPPRPGRLVTAQESPGGPRSIEDMVQDLAVVPDPPPLADQLEAQLLSPAELVAMPPPDYLIDDILVSDTVAVLFGKPASSKSFLALDWALCVAQGLPWQRSNVHRGEVLYIAAEGVRGLGKRVAAWQQAFDVPELAGVSFYPGAINLLDPERRSALVEVCGRRQPALVVIDTLARSMVGGDENSARDVGLVVDATDAIRQACSATVLVVHHTTKDGAAYRGSGALEGAADTMVEVESEDTLVTVTIRKQKDDEAAPPMKLTRQVVTLSGSGITSCVLRSHSSVRIGGEFSRQDENVLAAAREYFGNGSWSRSKLAELSKLPPATVYRCVAALVESGAIIQEGSGKYPTYRLAAGQGRIDG